MSTLRPVDPNATRETLNLLRNLHALSGHAILFGHQDATAYGVGWRGDSGRSDIKSVCGSHPAVHGWDFGRATQTGGPDLSSVLRLTIEAFQRGGVNTYSWHMFNPVSGGDFYDLTPAVPHLLPGGSHHEAFRAELRRVSEFAKALRAPDGTLVPVVFRPFHEHNGHWFWWCRPFCTDAEFVALWHLTVRTLRDEFGVRNFLYAYSPDVFRGEEGYLERYPGDEYVDIMGHDNYRQAENPGRREEFLESLRTVVRLAERRVKLPALTETGLDRIGIPTWWTKNLSGPILADPLARRISWMLVWRNAGTEHHFAPSPGHLSVPDFREMASSPKIWLENDLPKLYADELE